MKRHVIVGVAVLVAMQLTPVSSAVASCSPRLLVLSAFPGEIDHLLAATDVDSVEQVDGRTFYIGTLEGNDVVLALSGIGLVNAEQTTRIALGHFRCGADPAISGIVFSGVSGGPRIGDVMIPARWTLDGATFFDIDPAMAAAADAAAQDVVLARATPVGDPACVGVDPDLLTTVEVEQPDIISGGDGASADGFGERALPCIPGGGDVFGCTPCRAPSAQAPDAERTVTRAAPFIDPTFFFGYFDASQPPPGDFIAVDMETAAVAAVADESDIPFIAFRAASDGGGDPLNLPGFPFQFFYYRQLAANNAAAVTLAFLDEWGAQ